MRCQPVFRPVALALAVAIWAVPAVAQTSGRSQAGRADEPPPAKSAIGAIDLEKFRKSLEDDPVLDLTGQGLRFYARVTANPFSPEAVLGDKTDLMYAPTRRGAAMTHDEFMSMVTPEELYSSGGIQAHEMLQWSLVNLVGQALVKKALNAFRNARSEAEIQAIRDQIDRELELLRRAREGGGGG